MDPPRQQGWCNRHSRLQRFSEQCRTHSLLYMGETHTVAIGGRCDCEQSQPIRQRLNHVLLPLRMSNRGIWTRPCVCFGPGIFHVRSLGNPKENVSLPSSALLPLYSTSLTGQSENETHTNTPLLAMKYVLQLRILTK